MAPNPGSPGSLFEEPERPWTEPEYLRWRERREAPRVPTSVKWCATGDRKMVLWRNDGTGEIEERTFRCKSWRCPRCRAQVGLVDYARCAQALNARGPWVYCVLTLPGHDRKVSIWERYRRAGQRWDGALRKRLQRRYGRVLYLQTWEAHRDGTPHLNVVLGGDSLMADVDGQGYSAPRWSKTKRRSVAAPRWRRWWREQAIACGFGKVTWCERLWSPREGAERPADGLAAYMIKLAHSLDLDDARRNPLDASAGELTRADAKEQTPIAAPKGFRRLRSSQSLLPPRETSGEYSGALRPAEEPTWTWKHVRKYQDSRALAVSKAFDALETLSAQGLPIPEQVSRIVARERSKQAKAATC